MHTHARACSHAHTHPLTWAHMRARKHARTHPCMHARTHAHAHTQALVKLCARTVDSETVEPLVGALSELATTTALRLKLIAAGNAPLAPTIPARPHARAHARTPALLHTPMHRPRTQALMHTRTPFLHAHTHARACTGACAHACMHAHAHTQILTCIHACMHASSRGRRRACTATAAHAPLPAVPRPNLASRALATDRHGPSAARLLYVIADQHFCESLVTPSRTHQHFIRLSALLRAHLYKRMHERLHAC